MSTKTKMTSALDQELSEATEQLNIAMSGHYIALDDIETMKSDGILSARDFFSNELTTIQSEFDEEKRQMEINHAEQMQSMTKILTRLEHEFQESEADKNHEFQSQREEVLNRNLEEKQTMRINMENALEDLWKQFQKTLDDYNTATEDRREQFSVYRDKDHANSKAIGLQTQKLLALQDSVAGLKSKLASRKTQLTERRETLSSQKDQLQKKFQKMKRELGVFQDGERDKLKDLARTSSKVMTALKVKVDYAEDIVRLASLNAKLETEHELYMPYSSQDEPSVEISDSLDQIQEISELERRALIRFHQRYNRAKITQQMMKQKRDALRTQNQQLKQQVQRYFDNMTVDASTLETLSVFRRNALE